MRDLQALQITVGAGLPAMVVNDDAYSLTPSGALRLFAGKPAPTGSVGACGICKHCKLLWERACPRWSSTMTRAA
ncbi:hypothetical protein PspS04_11740 [Pseudomonas sp. S04]|nr:hypothetical protein PspS04_11740 [Pseudomonas sp. S04]QHF33468.1 hypothetical protein PspS19_11745 [Pseudomonas sp. S19]